MGLPGCDQANQNKPIFNAVCLFYCGNINGIHYAYRRASISMVLFANLDRLPNDPRTNDWDNLSFFNKFRGADPLKGIARGFAAEEVITF